jgi:hypothetical protein
MMSSAIAFRYQSPFAIKQSDGLVTISESDQKQKRRGITPPLKFTLGVQMPCPKHLISIDLASLSTKQASRRTNQHN